MTSYVGTKQAAQMLRESEPTTRKRADIGELACTRTESGRRIFVKTDVLALAARLGRSAQKRTP